MDDYDLSPPMARYSDYPASLASSHSHSHNASTPHRSPNAPSFDASHSLLGTPMDPNRTPTQGGAAGAAGAHPHLMGLRAESGSIFREAVWPPPGEPSTFVDPIVSASSAVDLGRIVNDVMGPGAHGDGMAGVGNGGAGAGAGSHPPSAFRGGANAGMVPEDPFASLSNLNTPHGGGHQPPSAPPSAMHSRETSETPLLPKSSGTGPPRGFFDRSRGPTPEPPGSPVPMPKMGPLFVTNMGPLSPASESPGSPPAHSAPPPPPPSAYPGHQAQASASQGSLSQQPRNWLERSPKKGVRQSLEREREASAPASGAADVDVSSAGHGMGEAL
ncbi:hypothetical protein BV20DRAFT_1002030 [Pilatotrama ljubarskyi]|nr:hypothetical protein BV20DRAFT_1002030 [Pilatotrama ljubarskyi]